MAVNSVSAATTGVQQQFVPARQTQEAEPSREGIGATKQQQSPPPERPAQAERPEPPRPVVNAQGQKTGSIINTTA